MNQGLPPLQPSTCPSSVMARAKADPKFGDIFLFDTPVLMWDQHFTPETWDRLKTRHVPYGWQGLSHTGMDLTGMGVAAGGAMGGSRAAQGAWGAQQKALKMWSRQRSPVEQPGTLVSSHSASRGWGGTDLQMSLAASCDISPE